MATIEKVQRRERGRLQGQGPARRAPHHSARASRPASCAERWARRLETGMDADDTGLVNEGQKHTLADAITRYRAEVIPELRPETARKYEQHLEFWGPKLGHLRLSEITPAKIAKVRDELAAAGKAPATRNRYMATARQRPDRLRKGLALADRVAHDRGLQAHENNGGTRFLSEDGVGPPADRLPGVQEPRPAVGRHAVDHHRRPARRNPGAALEGRGPDRGDPAPAGGQRDHHQGRHPVPCPSPLRPCASCKPVETPTGKARSLPCMMTAWCSRAA